MTFVSELEPRALWSHFDEILTIPRGSKKEDEARDFVISVAERNGLDYDVDDTGNVVVRKPAVGSVAGGESTILQAHLDMVHEKNSDVDFDFDRDAIRPVLDGDYLMADGTTLGSDNGIGVAAMLALMEADDVLHGPLEFLFTIDEETGLTGASGLADGMLTGRRLINLDSEEERVLTIGCAGGADSHLTVSVGRASVLDGWAAVAVRLTGLKGGHSGVDIHLQRGNAIRLLARALYAASLEEPLRVASFGGGNAHNAIPREAVAVVVAPAGDGAAGRVEECILRELDAIASEIATVDPNLSYEVGGTSVPQDAWDVASTRQILALVTALPHGVMAMSSDIQGLVETSTNLAVVHEEEDQVFILMSSRSSVMSALTALRQRIRSVAWLAGADVEEEGGYPAWQPDLESSLLQVVKGVHERIAGEAEIGAVHAGLECGIVDERVKISSVGEFFRVLTATLEELAGT
jgi:dipeptidase D